MKINYRAEIDGLRAIAVLFVIFYHFEVSIFNIELFKGGFIGVDIFFVISGYLITSIIIKEIIVNKKFSFSNFYQRRIRRILPALLFVILLTYFLVIIFFLPSNLIDFAKSVIFILLFTSNFYFHYSGQEYDADSALFKPFLNTWSLSIEEQFYILYPIFLFLVFKYVKKYLIQFLIFGFVLSLCFAEWGSRVHPSFTFYTLPTRMWELLAGSILAYFEIIKDKRKNLKNNSIFVFFGLSLIIYSAIFFDDRILHPSLFTLIPIIGTCFILWFSSRNEAITKLFSFNLFRGIGLISYSLYLWHFPILAFTKVTEIYENSFNFKAMTILVIFFLSVATYYFIEKPFRKHLSNKKIKTILPAVYIFIFLTSLLIVINNGYPNRFHQILNNNFVKIDELIKQNYKKNINEGEVIFYEKEKNININLVGDSHAKNLSFSLLQNLNKNKYNFSTSVYDGCIFIININRVNKKTGKKSSCDSNLQAKRKKFLIRKEKSITILFGRLPLILEEERFYNIQHGISEGVMNDYIQDDAYSLKNKKERQNFLSRKFIYTINELLKNNHKIILVYPMPEMGFHVPRRLYNYYKLNKLDSILKNKNFLGIPYGLYEKRVGSSFLLMDSIKNENVFRVFPHKIFCNNLVIEKCIAHDEKNVFYLDDDHPSLIAADLISEKIINIIDKISIEMH